MSKSILVPKHSRIRCAAAVVTAILVTAAGSVGAEERPCVAPGRLVPIAGKVLNNSVGTGESLGTLHGTIDGSRKLKCGIHGKPFFNPDGSFAGFTHSLVCDDTVIAENGVDTIHSQVVSISRFIAPPSFRSCGIPGLDLNYGAFREISEPQSGRGIFSPSGGGRLLIDGVVNCAGAIDMNFAGEICVMP